MKNTFLIILAIFFIIICLVSALLINIQSEKKQITQENKQYEDFLNKETLGTDLASLISKVVDKNEKNSVPKDEKGYYIDNNQITKFVQNFNLIKFKCTSIEYHKTTGKISKLVFEEQQ